MSTSNSSPPVYSDEDKFDGTNFPGFKNRILVSARVRGARGYLDGTIARPSATAAATTTTEQTTETKQPEPTGWTSRSPSLEEWELRDGWALALVAFNTKNPMGLGVKTDGSAAEAWKSIEDTYGKTSEYAAAQAEKDLRYTQYTDGTDFPTHITTLCEKWRIALDKGATIDDRAFRVIILTSMPASWDILVSTLYGQGTSSDVITSLLQHWDRLKARDPTLGTVTTALQARSPQSPKKRLVCTNSNCKRNGHTIDNCYWPGGGKEGQFPPNFRNRGRVTDTQQPSQNTTAATASTMPETGGGHTYALSARSTPILDNGPLRTYADSGATHHCFVNRNDFVEYERFATPRQGMPANKDGSFTILHQQTIITLKLA